MAKYDLIIINIEILHGNKFNSIEKFEIYIKIIIL